MFLVVLFLYAAAALGLLHGFPHGIADAVGVHDDAAVDVSRSPPDGLDQGGRGAQEADLIGIQDADEGNLGQVESLAQEVNTDQHVEAARPEIGENLGSLEGLDFGVEVADFQSEVREIIREIFGHLLGEGRDEDALARVDTLHDGAVQMLDLALGGLQLDLRVQ